MAKPKRALKKKLEQAELQELDAVQITIRASEMNLQRLAALLLFADHLEPKLEYKQEAPMPWEDPTDPRFQKPPELQLNRNAIQNALMPLLENYQNEHDYEKTAQLIQSFGAPRLSELSDTQLLDLHQALAGEAAGE